MDLRRLPAALTTSTDADAPLVSTAGIEELPQLAESVIAPAACSAEPPSSTDPTALAVSDRGMADYQRLQRSLLAVTATATALAVPISGWFFGGPTALSLLVGGLAGLLYLFLFSRSVSRLGVATKSVGKAQLLGPLLLVFAATRLPHLQVVPALVGFLLYKPALIIQAVLDR